MVTAKSKTSANLKKATVKQPAKAAAIKGTAKTAKVPPKTPPKKKIVSGKPAKDNKKSKSTVSKKAIVNTPAKTRAKTGTAAKKENKLPVAARKKAPVKKVAVKKAPVKKAPVKKAAVKKAPVKKAPVQNAAQLKTPAGNSPVKKSPQSSPAPKSALPMKQPLPIVAGDSWLEQFAPKLEHRMRAIDEMASRLTGDNMPLKDFASGHEYYGLHRDGDGWIFREWAPNASEIFLIGGFSNWRADSRFALKRISPGGDWEIRVEDQLLCHGDSFKLLLRWPGGEGERIPAWARRVIQNPQTHLMAAQVWEPPTPYAWKCQNFHPTSAAPLIYETHVGMALEDGRVGTFREFTDNILQIIADAGYNTIQIMAILEHPYYGSFGYHVTNFFAVSSRFGTPDEFKELVDRAHSMGLSVIIDLVHSHAAKNVAEGISQFDGTSYQYFHEGPRGDHIAWDSRCFNYNKPEVLHFLLSNCRFWLDEYHLDGFRFDGVTSVLYHDHGLGKAFTCYNDYFSDNLDEEAQVYLGLANRVIHETNPRAMSIAEDVSGMPGLAAPLEDGGLGFDYRLAMGTPDHWIKIIKEVADENWNVGALFWELTSRRRDEKTIGYAESHDQALVGDKTIFFRLVDAAIYTEMSVLTTSSVIDRGLALHKMIRLITLSTSGHGYLNFMGNEFGHPEWIDFPREGNNWSYHHARRQWHLKYDPMLRYHFLADFDKDMMAMCKESRILGNPDIEKIYEHIENQLLGFRRGRYYFFFNFNPHQSFVDWAVHVPPGEYHLRLDTDQGRYGGYERIRSPQTFFTLQQSGHDGGTWHQILLYVPSRAALVLEKVR
jgi:1,4-alpha-glucan branching enzyme